MPTRAGEDLPVAGDGGGPGVGTQERERLPVAVDPDLPDVAVRGEREQAQGAGHDEVDVGLQLAVAAGRYGDGAEVGTGRPGGGYVAGTEVLDELVEV
nr:hypothetical protein [Pseudonocardia acidicola]